MKVFRGREIGLCRYCPIEEVWCFVIQLQHCPLNEEHRRRILLSSKGHYSKNPEHDPSMSC